jgi:hypothetical protein
MPRSPRIKKPPKYAAIRRLALALPGTHEETDRHGTWFNIGRKTFALYWAKSERWILRLPVPQVMMLIEARSETFSPMRTGSMLWAYVRVETLSTAELRDYVTAAWRYTAPKKLQSQHGATQAT